MAAKYNHVLRCCASQAPVALDDAQYGPEDDDGGPTRYNPTLAPTRYGDPRIKAAPALVPTRAPRKPGGGGDPLSAEHGLVSTHGNRFVTTLHALNSLVLKLSKLATATTVYRSVAGGVSGLPAGFRLANEVGGRGVADAGFLSATLVVEDALHHAAAVAMNRHVVQSCARMMKK